MIKDFIQRAWTAEMLKKEDKNLGSDKKKKEREWRIRVSIPVPLTC